MATDPIKQDGSATGLRYTVEDSFGVVDATQDWITLEPNSYDTFGPTVSTVARQPINELRQNRLGVVSDVDANASFETDFTQSELHKSLGISFSKDRKYTWRKLILFINDVNWKLSTF